MDMQHGPNGYMNDVSRGSSCPACGEDRISPDEQSLPAANKQADIFVRQILNIGEAMYQAGAEISRIEDSLYRVGKAYGALHISVYAITTNIIVTAEFEGDYSITQNRRIRKRGSIDCEKLEELNQLCRACAAQPIPIRELQKQVQQILQEAPGRRRIMLGQFIAAFAFTIFFGGTIPDAFVAALGVGLICAMQIWVRPVFTAELFFNLVTSLATGVCISLLNLVIPGIHVGEIMIGDIMVLIPGVAITNSIRYIFSGDMVSSFEKLMDSLLQAFGIAVGFMLSLLLVKGAILLPEPIAFGPLRVAVQLLAATFGTYGFCLIFNMKQAHILIPTLGGLLCWAAYLLLRSLGAPVFAASLAAAFLVGIYGEVFARIIRVPTTILFIPACVPLIPGGNLYYSSLAVLSSDWESFQEQGLLLVFYALGIALGLAAVVELERAALKLRAGRGRLR